MATPATPPPEARALLDRAEVIWLTTVSPDGQPQTSPVWFLFDDPEFIVYSRPDAPRIGNLRANPLVSLNLIDDRSPRAVSIEGTAAPVGGPPATDNPAVVTKYAEALARMGTTAEWFAAEFSQPVIIKPTRWRSEDVS
jgi:PPOX class probable F420-dependent enzyme